MRLNDVLDELIWYVIKPPHTACSLNEEDEVARVPAVVLEEPISEDFPREGLYVQLPVARFDDDVFRTIHVTKNSIGALMMDIYLFYWSPIGRLDAIADVPDDCLEYRKHVEEEFERGGQPTWGALIGCDSVDVLPEDRRDGARACHGFCSGAVAFHCLRPVSRNVFRLACNS